MKKVLAILWCLLPGDLFAQQNSGIFINEFLASNVSIDADIVDFDDYSDWIELYNTKDVDADIGGCFLTDDLDNPDRWQIPPGTIVPARGFLRLWADGYDNIPGKTYRRPYYPFDYFTTRYYHLNFSLSRAGEVIALFGADGVLIDSVRFALQLRDVSMGRKPDGGETRYYFGEPTPAAGNSSDAVTRPEYAEQPAISLASGFYQSAQTISISVNSPSAVIRFTLDGSKPSSQSESYLGPLTIQETTALRVRGFDENKLPGPIATGTYFIAEEHTLPVVAMTFPPETFWDNTFGIYSHSYKDREIPVHFEFFRDNQPAFYLDAGARLTGQQSLYYPQKSFTIEARDRYGTDQIGYQVFPQRELNIFKSLYLRNAGVPDNGSTFFRDALQHTLVLNKIDIDCQAYLPAAVFLNGDYWGIYNVRDKIDPDYLASLHNLNPDDVDLLEYGGNRIPAVMSGSADDYNTLYDYVASADLSTEQDYQRVSAWMDIDEYINYQICEIFCDNVFWPDQNVRMWRERKDGAKWRWILFDTDVGFGMPNQYSNGYRHNTLTFATNTDGSAAPAPWSTLIFRKLLTNPDFKDRFIQRFASYLNTIFHPDTVTATIDSLQNRLSVEMSRHIARWRNADHDFGAPIRDYATWLDNVQVMRDFGRNRPTYQRQHIENYFNLAGTTRLNLEFSDPAAGSVRINKVESVSGDRDGLYFKGIPIVLEAVPVVGYRFVKWEGLETADQNPVSVVTDADSLTIRAQFEPVTLNTIPPIISSEMTLSQSNSPYFATGHVRVDSNAVLNVESGVEVFMPEGASIIVQGGLLIAGTPEHPATIAPYQQAGHWGALCFVNATDSSVISNVRIVGATGGSDFERDRAAMSGYNSRFSLHRVTVEDVAVPVFAQYGRVSVKACTLHTDIAGDLINIKYAESATVEGCDLRGNDRFDSDAIDFDGITRGIVRANHIYNFYGFNSDAIDLGEGVQDVLIENNVIYNINDKGVSIGGGSTANIIRNVFANCGQGIGIKDFDSYGYIEHNTFYANQAGVSCFVKNIGEGGGRADAVNCLFANNRGAPVFVDALSELNVSYSMSNMDELPGLHNIKAEPRFGNNLYPVPDSPAIDQGHPSLPPDPDDSLPDIGAYAFDQARQTNLFLNEIHYHPAEGDSYEFIEIVNGGATAVDLNRFRLSGDVHLTFADASIPAGEIFVVARDASLYQQAGIRVFQWHGGRLSDGPGNILLFDGRNNLVDFVHYDRDFGWPSEPDGQGPSLELHTPSLENMVSTSWRSSYVPGGSPGKSNQSVAIGGLYINEFLASNDGIYADEKGDYDDWIEIYNSNGFALNIGGMYLTDNLRQPAKHQIPNYAAQQTTIPANGYLLLWADGQTAQGPLHLSFKLDKAGEQIGLVQISDTDTTFIDSLTFDEQQTDVSSGRSPDGSDNWQSFDTPTPLDSNRDVTSVEAEPPVPARYSLSQNYPNPFNPRTAISYQLPVNSNVELVVYNLVGQKVATLVSEKQPAGNYSVEWDATGFASGVYLYRIRAGSFFETRKLAFLK